MPAAKLSVVSPEPLYEFLRSGKLNQALTDLIRQAGCQLVVEGSSDPSRVPTTAAATHRTPIEYRGQATGHVAWDPEEPAGASSKTALATAGVLEHLLDREMALGNVLGELMGGYEELNLLYDLLPAVAMKAVPGEIGDFLVSEAAKTLACKRVSLLILDEDCTYYRVLATYGLPDEAKGEVIPVSESVAGHCLNGRDIVMVQDMSQRPELSKLSRGQYQSDAFVVVRVPLTAHGEALGFLTATEREDGQPFTSRDHKLLEGLSAIGASALLNCRLHDYVKKQMISTIHALASAVDAKDRYTHDHAGRVARLCVATAREMGLTDAKTAREVELAGLLHDVGKIGIRDAILQKPDKLTTEEFKAVQAHTRIGAQIIGHVPGLEDVTKAVLHHHERYDGLGYPSGLAGDDIPVASMLIAVADTFDALTTDRPYRKASGVESALQEIRRVKGTQLHPDAVVAFEKVVRREMDRSGAVALDSESLISIRPAITSI